MARATCNWRGPWQKTPGRLLGTTLVRLYQLTLSGFVGNSCRHLPTCSEYAYEAIARHGLWAGGWMGLFRVSRCGRMLETMPSCDRQRENLVGPKAAPACDVNPDEHGQYENDE